MQKSQRVILIATIILILAIIAGIIIQINSPKTAIDTTYEILAFTVSGSSVLIAILSQTTAYRERKEATKMIHDLNQIIAANNAEKSRDQKLNQKLDTLLEQQTKNKATKK